MNTQPPSRLSFAVLIAAALACNITGVAETTPDATGTFAAMLTQVSGTAKAELPTQPAATLAPPTSAPPTIAPATNPPTSAALPKPASTFTSAPTATKGTAGCVDDGKLIAHITIPNGTVFAASTAFTKTWRVQNTGTCTWNTTYSLKVVGGVGGFGPGAIAIPGNVIPGAEIDLSVRLTSPGTAGSHGSIWRLHNSTGNAFGSPLDVSIVVSTPFPSIGVTPRCIDDGKFIADITVPTGTTFAASTAFTKTWRVQNTGTCTWNTTYSLKFVGGVGGFGPGAIAMPGNVIPGAEIDLSVRLTSPETAGSHSGRWQLHNSMDNAFGSLLGVSIVVSTPFPSIGVTPLGSRASDYAGNWFNNNVNPITGITQLSITVTSTNSISVQGVGKCPGGSFDCTWGTGTGTVSGTTITVSNFPNESGTNVLSIPSSGALRAVRSGNTYDFHLGPVASDWVGTWTNIRATNSSAKINITKIIIGVSGAQLTFHPYVKCTPSDCDWGTKNFAYNNPVSTGVSFPHYLFIKLIWANWLQIIDLSENTNEDFRRR